MFNKKYYIVFATLVAPMEIFASRDMNGVVNNNNMVWIALFALSVIGILALYVSSGQVETIANKYDDAQMQNRDIKHKHDVAISVVNERLKNSTIGIHRHRELIEELAAENPDLEILQREAKRIKRDESLLEEAAKDLDNFKSIQSGKLFTARKPFNIKRLINSLKEEISPYLRVKSNEFEYEVDLLLDDEIHGDFERIKQILRAIIVEMNQSMFGGKVSLKVLSVPGHKNVIFEITSPDSQADMTSFGEMFDDKEIDGSQHGIQMLKNYIAKGLIELMGGEYAVDNQEVGANCRITLPIK